MDENNKYAMLTDPDMKEIVDSFIVETYEILEQLDSDLVQLEEKPEDDDLLNKIFRAFHTIKGTSGFLGLEKLQKVTHRCEDILNKLRKGEVKLFSDLMDVILDAYDKIKELIYVIENEHNENVALEDTLNELEEAISAISQGKTSFKSNEVSDDGAEESKVPEPEHDEENYHEEDILDEEHVAEANSVKDDKLMNNVVKTASMPKVKKEDTSIRVEVERLDDLLNIVSELVLGRNQLAQVNSEVALDYEGTKMSRDLAEATKQIDLMTNELQLVVMKTRMVKIGKVFNRFPRVVRDLSKDLDKKIKLLIRGEETELDKTLIEEINDPLTHLIRNSIDHGIESPEERIAAGKDPQGSVTLAAEHEGNNILITIEDDGKGIDPEVIKNKAMEKGLLSEEKAKTLSKKEILNLIFLPGFSTAKVVTNVSGRGVGMDVVRTNVSKLRGIIDIDSNVGHGTKFNIKLPLTLAIIAGMLVRIKEETLVVPLSSVVEVLRVKKEEISTVNGNEVINVRERVIPIVSIEKMLYEETNEDATKTHQFIVIVGIAERLFGIKVDELIGQKEVVIKSLGKYLGNIHGIAGSSIMGDGRVVMILDIAEILTKVDQKIEKQD